jgi:hypothetical protein
MTKKIILCIVAAGAVAIVAWRVHGDDDTPSSVSGTSSAARREARLEQARMPFVTTPAKPATDERPVSVARDAVLARVGGTSITGRDLVATSTSDSISMSRPMFEALVERAIDRELAIQKARADGLALDAVRMHQLEVVR